MITSPSYRVLSIVLYVISAIAALAGLWLIFFTTSLLSMIQGMLVTQLPADNFVVVLFQAIGIIELVYAYLLCAAARDPVRYIAVVDSLIFLLLAAALLNIYALAFLHLHPAAYLIGRAFFQIVVAAIVFGLRPKVAPGTAATTTG